MVPSRALIHLPRLDEHPFGFQQLLEGLVGAIVKEDPEKWTFTLQTTGLKGRKTHLKRLSKIVDFDLTEVRCLPVPDTVVSFCLRQLRLPSSKQLFGEIDLVHTFASGYLPDGIQKLVVTVADVLNLIPGIEASANLDGLLSVLESVLPRASVITTISEFSKQEILRVLPWVSAPIRVIPCGVDHQVYKPACQSSREQASQVLGRLGVDQPYVISMGGNVPRKNFARLVRSFLLLKERYKLPHVLLLGGSGHQTNADIESALESSVFRDSVVITGYLSPEDLPALLKNAQALACASIYEGFGLPPLEAMACGVPVASSSAASLREVGGDAVTYFDPLNEESMAEALYVVLTDEELRARHIQDGLQRAAQFTWQKAAQETLRIYDEVMAS